MPEPIVVPDVPAPDGVCWRQGPLMHRCRYAAGHDGLHQWESPVGAPMPDPDPVAEAVSLLSDVEWAGTDSVYLTRFCVWCDANEKHGHADNCRYVAFMAKARLT